MKAANVNTHYVRRLADAKTGVGFITLSESGQNSIIIVGGANMHYNDLTKLPAEFYEAIDKSQKETKLKVITLNRQNPSSSKRNSK